MNNLTGKEEDLTVIKRMSEILLGVALVTNVKPMLELGAKKPSQIKVSLMVLLECICQWPVIPVIPESKHLFRTSDTGDTFARRMTPLNASCGVTTVLFSTQDSLQAV